MKKMMMMMMIMKIVLLILMKLENTNLVTQPENNHQIIFL